MKSKRFEETKLILLALGPQKRGHLTKTCHNRLYTRNINKKFILNRYDEFYEAMRSNRRFRWDILAALLRRL